MSQAVVTYGGWIIGLLTVLATALIGWRKSDIDESAMVLGKWKELVEAHQSQIGALNEEITLLRTRLAASEKDFADYRRENDQEKREYRAKMEKRIRDLEEENAGLKRAIAQNSQSAAYLIGGQKGRMDRHDKRSTGQDQRIDRNQTTIEDNRVADEAEHTQMNESIHKLEQLGHNEPPPEDETK